MPTGQLQRRPVVLRYDKETSVDGPEICRIEMLETWLTEVQQILRSLAVYRQSYIVTPSFYGETASAKFKCYL